jgi:hypothetical protein
VLAGGAAAATPPWKPLTVERHAGTVAAVLGVERRSRGEGFYQFRKLHLRVRVAGKTVFDRPICSNGHCNPGSHHSLRLQNVAGSDLDEAVVSIYTGGAHCCFESLVVLVDGPHAGRMLDRNWGDPGFRGEWRDGRFEFVTADDRFAYQFTSFAGSGLPAKVWTIDDSGRFANVTSSRLDLVRADAKRYWKAYVDERGKRDSDVRGVVAA